MSPRPACAVATIEDVEVEAPAWCPHCAGIVPEPSPARAVRRLRDIAWIAAIELEQDAERLAQQNLPESARVRAEMAAALHAAVRAAGGSPQ